MSKSTNGSKPTKARAESPSRAKGPVTQARIRSLEKEVDYYLARNHLLTEVILECEKFITDKGLWPEFLNYREGD